MYKSMCQSITISPMEVGASSVTAFWFLLPSWQVILAYLEHHALRYIILFAKHGITLSCIELLRHSLWVFIALWCHMLVSLQSYGCLVQLLVVPLHWGCQFLLVSHLIYNPVTCLVYLLLICSTDLEELHSMETQLIAVISLQVITKHLLPLICGTLSIDNDSLETPFLTVVLHHLCVSPQLLLHLLRSLPII